MGYDGHSSEEKYLLLAFEKYEDFGVESVLAKDVQGLTM